MGTPQSNEDWIIHSINIHGIFFERWCQKVIAESPGWSIDATNYPVEFPPPNGPIRGKESTLDIRASHTGPDLRQSLLVECKKNNPAFINWVFFRKPESAEPTLFHLAQVTNEPRTAPATGWATTSGILGLAPDAPIADEARETRGDYAAHRKDDKTKTSNAAIQDAAYQVALATQAIVQEDISVMRDLGYRSNPPALPWSRKIYLPTIVTTARMFVCDFDPADVSPLTGEVPLDRATLKKVEEIIYQYALPRHLQFAPLDLAAGFREGIVDRFTRMHILVVQSDHLEKFLATAFPEGNDAPVADHEPEAKE